jgi:hypothetical protein
MSTIQTWFNVRTAAAIMRGRMMREQARRVFVGMVEQPRSAAFAAFGALLLMCCVLLGMTHLLRPMQSLTSDHSAANASPFQNGVAHATAPTGQTDSDMTFVLPAPTGIKLESKDCPWLKDTRSRACGDRRGRKVVNGNLILCGGCGSYFFKDKLAVKGGAK